MGKTRNIIAVFLFISFLLSYSGSGFVNDINDTKITKNTSNDVTSNVTSNVTYTNVTNITYRVSVDQDYGFYRVIDITTHKPAPYENDTLSINIGDIVEWINDATPDEPLTILSKEGLWGNRSAYLRWNYQKFNYTFNQSGVYDVYVREYPRMRHMAVIVKGIVVEVTPIPTKNPMPTKNISIDTYTPTENYTNYTPTVTFTERFPPKSEKKTVPGFDIIIGIIGITTMIIYFKRI